uniref:PABS domain-containing protein n=1 Tax=Chaetoceros debilis TaxID=122233 RepID=A0A7S3V6I4_9STRA
MANKTKKRKEDVPLEMRPYRVRVTGMFVWTSLAIAILMGFSIGRSARIILLKGAQALLAPHDASTMFVRPDHSEMDRASMPRPVALEGKEVPTTLYTAKNFDTSIGSSAASVYLERNSNTETCESAECRQPSEDASASNPVDDSDHLPAGQHLLVDIKNVDGTFLNSETRLADALVGVVNESRLTLLSYHCHKLIPLGVSCVGVLLESHISFHTWPEDGVITLDLFTCGSGELVPVLPVIERLFGIPQVQSAEFSGEVEPPHVVWTHKLRGVVNMDTNPLSSDLGAFVLEKSNMDLKSEVGRTRTKFQRIDVFDTIDATQRDYLSYRKSLEDDASYESKQSNFFLPNREIYLDGVLQSTRHGNEAYHEALVHPAMMTHPNPKKVGIIGGGEGATLREVLKHNTLEKVKMIEIDEEMVSFSREHLPDWNTCSDPEGSAIWCGDDDRAEMYYEDGLAWFNNRFSDDSRIDTEEFREEPFDVLIMDALDPQDDVPFADILYTNEHFFKTLYNALNDDGLIILQLGASPDVHSPPERISHNRKRAIVMQSFENLGFRSVHVYHEGHCQFRAPWSFAVAFKGANGKSLWQRTAAQMDIQIRNRMIPTKSGEPTLKYFDGAVMEGYKIPPKGFEAVFCKALPTPASCLSDVKNMSQSRSVYDPFADRHTYMSKDSKHTICDDSTAAIRSVPTSIVETIC